MSSSSDREDAKRLILERRRRFIAAAVAGVGIAACGKTDVVDGGAPAPCLSVMSSYYDAGPIPTPPVTVIPIEPLEDASSPAAAMPEPAASLSAESELRSAVYDRAERDEEVQAGVHRVTTADDAKRLILERRRRFIAAAVASAGLAACGKTEPNDGPSPTPCLAVPILAVDAAPAPPDAPARFIDASAGDGGDAPRESRDAGRNSSGSGSGSGSGIMRPAPSSSARQPASGPRPCLTCLAGPGENCDLPFRIEKQ